VSSAVYIVFCCDFIKKKKFFSFGFFSLLFVSSHIYKFHAVKQKKKHFKTVEIGTFQVEASNVKKGMLRVVIDVVLFSLSRLALTGSTVIFFSLSFLGDDFFPFFFVFTEKERRIFVC